MTETRSRLRIRPLSFADACTFVEAHHRHHAAPRGHKFSLGVVTEVGELAGAAIIGRPVARVFDDGLTLEVTRLATNGTANACSALYGAAARVARAAGYHRILTYTRADETGASLRGAGWRRIADRPARSGWHTPSRPRSHRGTEHTARVMWELIVNPA